MQISCFSVEDFKSFVLLRIRNRLLFELLASDLLSTTIKVLLVMLIYVNEEHLLRSLQSCKTNQLRKSSWPSPCGVQGGAVIV